MMIVLIVLIIVMMVALFLGRTVAQQVERVGW